MNYDIYLVSLKGDIERRNALEKHFPCEYRRFIYEPAVDGRILIAKEYYSKTIGFFDRKKISSSKSCIVHGVRMRLTILGQYGWVIILSSIFNNHKINGFAPIPTYSDLNCIICI